MAASRRVTIFEQMWYSVLWEGPATIPDLADRVFGSRGESECQKVRNVLHRDRGECFRWEFRGPVNIVHGATPRLARMRNEASE